MKMTLHRTALYSMCLYAFFSTVSITLAEIFFLISLAALAADCIKNRYLPRMPRFYLLLPLALFAVWHFACALAGVDVANSLKDYKKIYIVLMFFAAAAIGPQDVKKVIISFACGGAFTGIYAVITTIQHRFIAGDTTFRASSFSGNHMHAGGMLMMACVAAFTAALYALKNKSFREAALFGAATVLAGAGLAFTNTRGSYAGAVAGILIAGFILDKKSAIAVLLAVAALFIVFRESEFVKRVNVFERLAMGTSSDNERVRMWQSGLRIIKDNPLTGVGTANISKVYPSYRSPDAQEENQGHLHNNIIQLAAIDGIPGALLFLWFFGALFIFQVTALGRVSGPGFAAATGAFAAAAAFFINGMVEYNFFSSQPALIFWFTAGLGIAAVQEVRNEKN